MEAIDFVKIEKKWQDKWEKEGIFEVKENSKKKKFYVLDMFPYPSGAGLHMGHAFVYSLGDIYARFKRMQGFNVLYPIGYDSLGLPAENAAIKVGEHPLDYTEKAMKNFMRQQKAMGWSYDWSRMVMTHDPAFYRWDQWIFLQLFKKGLAYRKKAPVNWCSKCNTVLANEQVTDGKCWRHEDTEVEIKNLEQWFFKITDYAEELVSGLEKLDWPENAKKRQLNWIGKSEGYEMDFEIENKSSNISKVILVHGSPSKSEKNKDATTRTYDKHWMPWLKKELEKRRIAVHIPLMPEPWEPTYRDWKEEFEKIPVDENSVLIGHSAGGGFLVRWLGETQKKIKKLILVAPAIMHSGNYAPLRDLLQFKINTSIRNNVEEIIIFVSDNDSKGILESVRIFSKELGAQPRELPHKGHFTLGDMGTEEFPELLEEIVRGETWKIFTTRPDTIYGVTFMVVSAQHPRLYELVTPKQKKEVDSFLKKIKSTSEREMSELEKEGVFTGSYAINPANGEKLAVYAGNFVVADYGSGMVMAVPAHDQRDFEFANKYGIPIRQVIAPEKPIRSYLMGAPKISDSDLTSLGIKIIGKTKDEDRKLEIPAESLSKYEKLIEEKLDKGFWNEYIGKEIVFIFKHKNGKIERIILTKDTEEKIDKLAAEFIGKSWNKSNVWKWLAENYFYTDLIVHTNGGTLINSGKFDNLESEEAKEKIGTKFGKKMVNFKLRDWLISRQRYWGTPIPVVYCGSCGIVPVPEKDLPVVLPKKVKFGEGNPLATNKEFVNAHCPKCGGKARRETDTMDTFVNSSWYYLRYTDPKNEKKIFDEKKANHWAPIDQYIGGPEHITMHLIYARFYTKFLRDLGLLKFDEPAVKYFTQGIVHGSDGEKMSKSRGNVVEPLEMIQKFGADTLRLALVSFAGADKNSLWDEKIVVGSHKFINRVYDYFDNWKAGKSDERIESKLHKTIKEVSEDVEGFKHNLAVIKIRELFDYFVEKQIDKNTAESFLTMLHVYCPFVTEELWSRLGHKNFISLEEWPKFDEKKINEKFEIAEKAVDTTVSDIMNILKIMKEKKNVEGERVFVYVLPREIEFYDAEVLTRRVGKEVKVFAVNDSKKYDPQGKASKTKPGKPAIYVE